VFRSEPLPADHALRNFENVVLTPHIAFSTAEATTRLNQIAVDNIVNYCKGNPTNVVTI
jgi:D-3-phosphoglycerate dehydrogenase